MEIEEKLPMTGISDLPEEILEYILLQLSPYKDLKSAMLVCRQWHRLVLGVVRQIHQTFHHSITENDLSWKVVYPESGVSITERFSHCACYYDKSVYIFGGCTSTNTTFNDLWRFDLRSRQWIRPLAIGTYPSPKACASMVVYKDSLVLFGGWSHPTPYPLHQAAKFFSELHIYKPESNRWFHMNTMSPISPAPTAGHSATVVGDHMIIFGGSHVPGDRNNEVWVFDFNDMMWQRKLTSSKKPSPRYGQTQLTIDRSHILIIGGCGGPNQIFNDIWLLSMDTDPWSWSEIRIENPQFSAPHLWCHPGCKVGDKVVLLSKPLKAPAPSKTSTQQNESDARVAREKLWIPPRERQNREQAKSPQAGPSHSLHTGATHSSQAGPSKSYEAGSSMSPQPGPSSSPQASPSNSGQAGSTVSPQPSLSSSPRAGPSNITASGNRPVSGVEENSSNDSSSSEQHSLSSPFKHPGDIVGSSKSRLSASDSMYTNRLHQYSYETNFGHPKMQAFATSNSTNRLPSVRPNASSNREKQLEALRRFEEKLHETLLANQVPSLSKPVKKEPVLPMLLHVLDISEVVTAGVAKWQPVTDNTSVNAAEETVFYSLVQGRGELILFGGIQKDIQSMQRGLDPKAHFVSNNLYILSPKKHFL